MSDTSLQVREPEPLQEPDIRDIGELSSIKPAAMTPAQARVESVARTMDAAMNRASTLTLTPEENAALEADFPDEAFKPGAAGKQDLIYIEHAFLRDRFNAVIGRGQWALLRTRPHWAEEFRTAKGVEAVRLYADCALLIRGCMVAEAIGEMTYYKNNDSQNYGDAAEGAVTAAFRRCAKNFGVGLQAWKKDWCEGWWQRKRSQAHAQSAPKAYQQPMPHLKPTSTATTPLAPAPTSPFAFKNERERKAWLDAHLLRCKLKLVSDLEKGDPQAAVEFMQKAHHLLPNESAISEANELTLFPSVPHAPDERETDGDWRARVNEAVAKDALAIKRAFEAFQQGDQILDAEVGHQEAEPEQDHDPVPEGALTLNITVALVTSKSGQKKDKTTWTRWSIKDQNDLWYSTFSARVGKNAEALKGQHATIFFTETERGNDLHKIIPA